MHGMLEFLFRNGYWVLFVWVFLEQVGLPIPSVPILLACGAMAGMGQLNFAAAILSCLLGSLAADTLWYELGKRKGIRILQWLCRIAIEPDSCVRRTEGVFEKQGAKSLIFAKFLPGLGTVATPLAGVFHMHRRKFLLFDGLGALLWAGTYLALGFLFRGQLEQIARVAASLGGKLLVVVVAALFCYFTYKFLARQNFLRELRIARITADELKQKLDAGEELTIVDLRHSLDFEADPEKIPGAFRMDAQELTSKGEEIPHDREVILYCT